MNLDELIRIEWKSKPFRFFFALRTLAASLRRDILNNFFRSRIRFYLIDKPQYFQDERQYQFFQISLELSSPDLYQWQILEHQISPNIHTWNIIHSPSTEAPKISLVAQFSVHLLSVHQFRQIRFDIDDGA